MRRQAQTSIKYSTKSAAPWAPPKAHRSKGYTRTKRSAKTGLETRQSVSPLRELIFFAYDAGTRTVVIGPAQFGPNAAAVIEKGGTETRPARGRRPAKVLSYAPHPFMKPAGDEEARRMRTLKSMVK